MLNFCSRRVTMDRREEWPWNLEEEAEWKAELEEREQDFVEELMGDNSTEQTIFAGVFRFLFIMPPLWVLPA
jgi:hypothetical protein